MFTSKDYRARAAEFGELAKTGDPEKSAEFRKRERSFTTLADNEEWLADNFEKTLHPPEQDGETAGGLAATEEHGSPMPGSRSHHAVEHDTEKAAARPLR